jgi:hypothetical protein
MYIPGQICEKCEREIGKEPYVLIQDKITRGLHKFHQRCAPRDPDVRRHHGVTLEPGKFQSEGKSLGRV